MDVHVLQANGGNLPSIISLAVHAALKKIKLPCVTLYETSGGVSLEVDPRKAFGKPVDWSRLPVLAVMLVSPTRHYVVDPTLPEELALPQQLHVAVNAAGQVCHTRFQQLPSRRGNVWRLGGQQQQPPSGMNMPDFAAMLHDAPYICQAMISECDEALQKGE
ncbi:exosome-associated protein 1 [Trypanosoma grayi]|uniref:exosome-associated protein 1 n=1 Tax=Trypanosoma grayi TaxID=71804 RepID=UPI0004F3F09D|nr:exosome-associated protein 1 [Trypanosoma grayi]KEG07033.1 exosome-associated protein 1 [Trypanosoma grayi]